MIWITHVCSNFVDVLESKPPFLTAVQSLKSLRWTHSERSTAEGIISLLPNQQTRKAVVERANEKTDEEVYRLCTIANYAEILRSGSFVRQGLHETAMDFSAYLAEKLKDHPVLKMDE